MLNFQSEIVIFITTYYTKQVINYKFGNFTNTYILCNVLNSRAFQIDYIKVVSFLLNFDIMYLSV